MIQAQVLLRWGFGSAAVAVLVFLFSQSLATDADRHYWITERLREIKRTDAELNQNILKARHGLLPNYDSLVAGLTRLRALQAGLEHGSPALSGKEQQTAAAAGEALAQAVALKEQLVEDVKSANAVLNNSVRYLTVADSRLVQGGGDPALALEVGNLLRDVLLYNLCASQETAARIVRRAEALRKAEHPPATRTQLDLLCAHVTTILNYKLATDAVTARVIALPCARSCDELSVVHQTAYRNGLDRSNQYRLYLFLYAGVLLCYAVYVMLQLRTTRPLSTGPTTPLNSASRNAPRTCT